MKIKFLKYRKIYYTFSILLVIGSIASVAAFGLKFRIDFTGGSIMEVTYADQVPDSATIEKSLAELDLGQITLQTVGDKGLLLRIKHIDEATHQSILSKLTGAAEQSFETIGPVVGNELKQKTQVAIVLSLLAIIAYIAFAFRKVSYPAKSWQYGVANLVALFHDLLLPIGIFALLGKFYGVEITIPLVAALLTVLGYSNSDTVVVYDRIRENLLKHGSEASFEQTVDASLNQTLIRSTHTVFSVLLTLFALFFFGGESLKYFSLVLIIGIISGSYSSIFIASPLLATWVKWKNQGLTKVRKGG